MSSPLAVAALLCSLFAVAPARADSPAAAKVSDEAKAIVADPDRTEADRKLDAGRKPAEMITFFALKPGMKVAELGAGAGYTTELLARAVGPTGKVWAQNPSLFIQKFLKASWPERLKRPVMKNVVRVDREFDSPLPKGAKNLDAVAIMAIYHDTVWLKTDRAKMNKAVFNALKPGGAYLIVDTSAKPGTGLEAVQTLHRIDEKTVREEVEKAGFKLESESDFARNPKDTRDWSAAPGADKEHERGSGDRFALRYIKPKS